MRFTSMTFVPIGKVINKTCALSQFMNNQSMEII